jgi:DNA-binding winged helix-turn-helix (wHTH) protein/tetratricopeptide (TPR) repeat protein
MSDAVYEFGPFRYDAATRVLWSGREIVGVPPKALDLLGALLARAGEVVSKDDLLRLVWPDVVVEEANLSVNVSILRKALGRSGDGQRWIATVARRGYRFSGPVNTAKRAARSLAVLPFRSLGSEVAEEAIGLAMADAVITRLAGSRLLAVRPTSAVQRYAVAATDPREAGRALGVDVVLDGRLQRDGARLRLTVQLLPVSGESTLWADRFDAPFTDLFAVQDTVAQRLAAALAVELGDPGPGTRDRTRTPNLHAYEAYARGRWFWTRFSRSWLEKAVASFHEAAELDPAYAPPHAGLADASLAAALAGVVAAKDGWEMASGEADRALALDDRLAEARVSRAWVRLFRDWDWAGAEADFLHAARLDPASAAVQQWLGLFELLRGRPEAAQRALAAARARDPLSVVTSAVEGFRLAVVGEHDRELEQQRRTAELDPNQFLGHWALGTALQNAGRFHAAVEEHRRAFDLAEGAAMMRPVLARSLALGGRGDEARELLASTAEALEASPYQEATVLLALGDERAALERLRSACDARDPWAVLLPVDPMLRSLRDEPAFRKLAARVRGEGSHGPSHGSAKPKG